MLGFSIEISPADRKETLIFRIICGLLLYAANVDVELSILKCCSAIFFLSTKTGFFRVLCIAYTPMRFHVVMWKYS